MPRIEALSLGLLFRRDITLLWCVRRDGNARVARSDARLAWIVGCGVAAILLRTPPSWIDVYERAVSAVAVKIPALRI